MISTSSEMQGVPKASQKPRSQRRLRAFLWQKQAVRLFLWMKFLKTWNIYHPPHSWLAFGLRSSQMFRAPWQFDRRDNHRLELSNPLIIWTIEGNTGDAKNLTYSQNDLPKNLAVFRLSQWHRWSPMQLPNARQCLKWEMLEGLKPLEKHGASSLKHTSMSCIFTYTYEHTCISKYKYIYIYIIIIILIILTIIIIMYIESGSAIYVDGFGAFW